MSGYKCATVTIRRDEYETLLEKDKKLREKQHKQKLNKQHTQNLLMAYQDLEDRQEEYEQFLQKKMRSEIADIEKEFSRNLLRNQAEYYQGLLDQIRETEVEQAATQQFLLETTRSFDETLQEERQNNRELLEEMVQSISIAAQEDNAQKEEMTQLWLSDCMQLSSFIRENYDYNKFCPAEYEAVMKRLNLANENFQTGIYEAGIQFAQEAYLKLSEMRLHIEEKTSEWQARFQIVDEALESIAEEIATTVTVPAIGLNGEYLDSELNLVLHSKGKYTKLLDTTRSLRSELQAKAYGLEFQDLEYVSSKVIPKLKQDFETLISDVRQAALNVQIKNNIGYLAMKALESQGFEFDNAWYANDDEEDAFVVALKGIDGSHVSLQVTPTPGSHNANKLSVESSDNHINTGRELMARWKIIERALNVVGAQVGVLEVEGAMGMADIAPVIEQERIEIEQQEQRDNYYVH